MNNELLHLLAFLHMGSPFQTLTDSPYPGIGFLDYSLAFWRQRQTVSELQASKSHRSAECTVWSVAPEGTEKSTDRDRVSAQPGVAPWVWLSYLPSPGIGASLLSGKLFCWACHLHRRGMQKETWVGRKLSSWKSISVIYFSLRKPSLLQYEN